MVALVGLLTIFIGVVLTIAFFAIVGIVVLVRGPRVEPEPPPLAPLGTYRRPSPSWATLPPSRLEADGVSINLVAPRPAPEAVWANRRNTLQDMDAAPAPRPEPQQAQRPLAPDPKPEPGYLPRWTPGRRMYAEREQVLWQQLFDNAARDAEGADFGPRMTKP